MPAPVAEADKGEWGGTATGGSPGTGGAGASATGGSSSMGSGGGAGGSVDGGATLPGWVLTWSDEFNGPDNSAVDSTKWGSSTTRAALPTPSSSPFFIILNVAVGGNFPGAPSSSTTFLQTMKVDWVRV
jgi:hypothetical protein